MRRAPIALIITAATVVTLPINAVAQQDTGTRLTIQTTDMTGALIPSADVSIMSSEDGKLLKLSANGRGIVDVNLPAGEYQYRVASQGFCPRNGNATVTELRQQEVNARLDLDQCPGPCATPCVLVDGVQPTEHPVKIKVSDESGASIAGALIQIDRSSRGFREIKSDASGQAATGMPSGMHYLDVSAPGFRHWRGFVEVQSTIEVITARLVSDGQRSDLKFSKTPVAVSTAEIQSVPEEVPHKSLASTTLNLAIEEDYLHGGRKPLAFVTINNSSPEPECVSEDQYRIHITRNDDEPPRTEYYRHKLGDFRPGDGPALALMGPGCHMIAPNSYVIQKYDLAAFYDVSTPGRYSVYIEIYDPKGSRDGSGLWLRSGTAHFEVREPGR